MSKNIEDILEQLDDMLDAAWAMPLFGGKVVVPGAFGFGNSVAGYHVYCEAFREFVNAGLGGSDGGQGRQLHNGGHADGQHRKHTDPAKIL